MQDIADIATRLLGEQIKVRSIPAAGVRAAGRVVGPFAPMAKDMAAMIDWFQTGRYVTETSRQQQVFGAVPGPRTPSPDCLLGSATPSAPSPGRMRVQ